MNRNYFCAVPRIYVESSCGCELGGPLGSSCFSVLFSSLNVFSQDFVFPPRSLDMIEHFSQQTLLVGKSELIHVCSITKKQPTNVCRLTCSRHPIIAARSPKKCVARRESLQNVSSFDCLSQARATRGEAAALVRSTRQGAERHIRVPRRVHA